MRYALGVRYPQKLSSRELMARSGVPPVSVTLRRRRQRLLGHCLRSYERGNKIPLALVLLNDPNEHLRRGHARTVTLRRTYVSDLEFLGLDFLSARQCCSSLFAQRVRASSPL